MSVSSKIVPEGFTRPTALPACSEQERQWQEANRAWWESHPMRYDWKEGVPYQEFSREFFEEIDRRLFACANTFMPYREVPFDPLIGFASLAMKDVLEIGVGNGSHAQLLARHAKSYTGIDITEYAVKSTCLRMRCFNLWGRVLRMDAEQMDFPDDSFDFIWSWGVIHHSSSTAKILHEMRRVLRPGGEAIVMVYHRGIWNYYVIGGLLTIMQGDLPQPRVLHATVQRFSDGGLARYYSVAEWRLLASQEFRVAGIRIFGQKTDLIPLPPGRAKTLLLRALSNGVGRFLTNDCRMGSFLVSRLVKN